MVVTYNEIDFDNLYKVAFFRKIMKRILSCILLVSVLFCILTLGIVSAVITCVNGEDRMFRISSVTNAHAEKWVQTNYGEEICYEDYFQGYGSGVRGCAGGNKILGISGDTNAHVEIPTQSNYESVCYGDLTCKAVQGQCNDTDLGVGTDYSVIVSLADEENSHVSLAYVYPYRICCKGPHSPICNYDGVCDYLSRGETAQNCPDDCVCGNGQIDAGEVCDIGDDPEDPSDDVFTIPGFDCTDLDYSSGPLYCAEGCMSYDVSSCEVECDDGILSPGETCEPSLDPDGADCNDAEGYPGTRQCSNVTCNWVCDTGLFCGDTIFTSPPEECEIDDEESCEEHDFESGLEVTCDEDTCKWDTSQCVGKLTFCEKHEPFTYEHPDESGNYFSPMRCVEYNLVYPGSSKAEEREELCLGDCVAGASVPVNNGYAGTNLFSSGCAWDSDGTDGGQCYFYFERNEGDRCRTDFVSEADCEPDDSFREVTINASAVGGGTWTCDAGCGEDTCTSQIYCPTVIRLPFFGWVAFVSGIFLIGIIYMFNFARKR